MTGDGDLAAALSGAVESVTAKWAKQIRAEERDKARYWRRYDAMTRSSRITVKDAAWSCMREAYRKASAGGTLPANARQIMYAARPRILELTGKTSLDDAYFTQTLLPDYVTENGLEDAWDVVYDARGHLMEPHTGAEIALGTLQVRDYLNRQADHPMSIPRLKFAYPTAGPESRYSQILFIEKEGFTELLRQARISAKYDLAIMSTKGMSVVAARRLIDSLSGQVKVFIARDFDKAGFSIAATLTGDTRRYVFRSGVEYHDLGLRLADVEEYGLDAEPVHYEMHQSKVEDNLRQNGADDEEIEFLLGQRVELNAFTSDQFIDWLEAKLEEAGAEKVIPGPEILQTAWRRAQMISAVNAKIDEMTESLRDQDSQPEVPADLADRIRQALEEAPELSWDEALADIAEEQP